MDKYKTGCYHVVFFDKHGTKQGVDVQVAGTLKQAETLGKHLTQHPPYASFVIMGVLQNSKDS